MLADKSKGTEGGGGMEQDQTEAKPQKKCLGDNLGRGEHRDRREGYAEEKMDVPDCAGFGLCDVAQRLSQKWRQ